MPELVLPINLRPGDRVLWETDHPLYALAEPEYTVTAPPQRDRDRAYVLVPVVMHHHSRRLQLVRTLHIRALNHHRHIAGRPRLTREDQDLIVTQRSRIIQYASDHTLVVETPRPGQPNHQHTTGVRIRHA